MFPPMTGFKFTKKDYILYLLNRIEPEKSDRYKLNKVAFFVEFCFIHNTNQELTNVSYAGIDKGPIIDGYKALLEDMASEGLVKLVGYRVMPLAKPTVEVPDHIRLYIDPLITKYTSLTNGELINLAHSTDSYQITTKAEKEMGNVINKELAHLETFFDDEVEEDIAEDNLPPIQENKLEDYAFGQ